MIAMQQVHGNKIINVDKLNLNLDSNIFQIDNIDACFTTKKSTVLSVKSADCLPILISGFGVQQNNKQKTSFIAAAHAGRKGTELKILYKLLEKLNAEFNIVDEFKKNLIENNTQLNIWFGPAICVDCYQINKKANKHYNLRKENENQIIKFFRKHKLDIKNNLDLKINNSCTLHESEKYHSYRKTGPGVKMNYSFIEIT